MRKFVQKLSKVMVLSNFKAHRVDYPHVASFDVNIATQSNSSFMGIRHFNRDYVPAIRLANNELQFNIKTTRQDASITKPTIDVTFKDGTKSTYDATNKDALQIYMDLINVARGNSFVQRRRLPELDTSNMKPQLLAVEL